MSDKQSNEGPGTQSGGIVGLSGKGVKRKLKVHTIETKFQALAEVDKGTESKTAIAKKFEVPLNTLSTWIRNAEKIKDSFEQQAMGPQRKKMRTVTYQDTENATLQWFKAARDRNLPVSGPLLQAKAEEFALQLGETSFKCSTGWLDRFKDRHGITFKKVCGESKSVNEHSKDMTDWAAELKTLLSEYNPNDIFNADETGLFFRLLPDKTLDFKGADCHGGKCSKDRLTVLVCANMSGSEKIPLYVIGKAKNPRCFKNVKTLPTQYEANKKAWITSELFSNWLRSLDRKFQHQKRKVTMIVDNCPAHPKVTGLKAIKLIFLPPNTTSKTQPMDQGVIQNLKVHYRKLVILQQLKAYEDTTEPAVISVLDALRLLSKAWANVTAKTITNCFRHANFTSEQPADPYSEVDDDEDDPEDDIPLAALRLRVPFEEYANVDQELTTSEAVSDNAIVNSILEARKEDNEESDEDEDVQDQPAARRPSTTEIQQAIEVMRRWIETTENTSDLLPGLQKFERRVETEDYRRLLSKQQSVITSYFTTDCPLERVSQ